MIEIKEEFVGGDKYARAMLLGGSDAIVMWLALKAHAARHLTDGFVSEEDFQTLTGAPKGKQRALEALIGCGRLGADGTRGAGLVERVEHGYQLHDYLHHAESRERILAKREAARERKENWKRTASGTDTERIPERIPDDVPNATRTGGRSGVSTPTQPNPTQPEREPRARKAARLAPVNRPFPDDFVPDESCRQVAQVSRISLESELSKARDWAKANGRRCKDWQAFFRNWLRRAADSPRSQGQLGLVRDPPKVLSGPDGEAAIRRQLEGPSKRVVS